MQKPLNMASNTVYDKIMWKNQSTNTAQNGPEYSSHNINRENES